MSASKEDHIHEWKVIETGADIGSSAVVLIQICECGVYRLKSYGLYKEKTDN